MPKKMIAYSRETYPRFEIKFGDGDAFREPLVIDADEFIGVKSFKAKGKRISTFEIDSIVELEPTRFPDEEENVSAMAEIDGEINEENNDNISQTDVRDELTGQQQLFADTTESNDE